MESIKPGDTRTFKHGEGNAVVLAIGVWAARSKSGRQLHIHMTGTENFHTTVTNDPESERYHRTLFRDLRNLLVENNAWPFADEGAETNKASA